MKILVVEDDLLVAEALRVTLSDRNYAVEVAHDGRSGLEFIEAFDYDLLLLDAILPNLDGISLCRHVRSRGYLMPILLLTSRDSKHARAIGLDAGADDYVVKPCDPEELSARIRALLRRGNDRAQPVLKWEDLSLNPRNYEVTYQERLLSLTPKEYALLELFLRYNRRLFSCGAILEHLWTYEDAPSEEAVRTHIKGLRHKLKAAGAPIDFVETVYGIGYRLKSSEPQSERQFITNGGRQELTFASDDTLLEREPTAIDADSIVGLELTDNSIGDLSPKHLAEEDLQAEAESECPEFLTEIWNRHHEQMSARVATIDRAIIALGDGCLQPELRRDAWNCAHTLAGALGTFGLSRGSQLAKQIELALDANTELTPAQIPQLQSNLDRLRRSIASKMPAAKPSPASTSDDRSPWLLVISQESDLAAQLSHTAAGKFEIVRASELQPPDAQGLPPATAIVFDLDCFPHIADGLAALSQLDRDYPNIPTIVLSQPTSMDSEADDLTTERTNRLRQRIEVARRGARLFLVKPVNAQQIFQSVDRVVQQARTSQPKVTIVDDDLMLLEGVSSLLSQRGMTVTTLAEPSRFWETLETSAPDLLILDIDMPTYDGIELCRAVRTDPKWANLPILVLTAHTAAIASDRVFAAGADDFVSKPVVDATLVTRIVNRLDRIGFQRLSAPEAVRTSQRI
ncbi:response regulator [Chamaesiphon minutus]|uniref:Response regulator with CheY-like receiver domain and winged-helix DNA-binding domain n=1 Tax=Chamaesiphon minutus (strain ATCC 27169 / PCC 6605) TaxID=1173020 RepID=K9UAD5_CHAP6|nr:response regulator [Chamaesiphon minutus]AFY92082.1 response regulator with CheY-like receiver domain and winged-helix DNA-binding domain [Chamaesiphon minutus PCC 6605]